MGVGDRDRIEAKEEMERIKWIHRVNNEKVLTKVKQNYTYEFE